MKKVLSLLLAVVLVFSMATVALAGDPIKTCVDCGYTAETADDYNAHMLAGGCGKCDFCGNGFGKDDLADHEYICTKNAVGCDYCGDTFSSQANYDAHIEACKAKYFNIPLAKIIATVKDLIAKIDFDSIINTAKDLIGKIDFDSIVGTVKDLVGNINLG